MCASLPNCEFLDLCAADRAWFAFLIIHPKIILELTAAIGPINGCAVTLDACLQHGADRLMQRPRLLQRY